MRKGIKSFQTLSWWQRILWIKSNLLPQQEENKNCMVCSKIITRNLVFQKENTQERRDISMLDCPCLAHWFHCILLPGKHLPILSVNTSDILEQTGIYPPNHSEVNIILTLFSSLGNLIIKMTSLFILHM